MLGRRSEDCRRLIVLCTGFHKCVTCRATAALRLNRSSSHADEVKGTGVFSSVNFKRAGTATRSGGEIVSTAIFVLGLAVLLNAVNTLDMASKGL